MQANLKTIPPKPARAPRAKRNPVVVCADSLDQFKAPQGRVLALDLGTKLGYSVSIDGHITEFSTKEFSPKLGAGQRWSTYRAWLNSITEINAIKTIVFEDVKNHAGTIAAHVYGGFLAYTEEMADRKLIRMHGVGVTQVKKAWTGSGGADKAAMIQAAVYRGFRINDDNTADAIAIMHYFAGVQRS